jgi:hypothetical protein
MSKTLPASFSTKSFEEMVSRANFPHNHGYTEDDHADVMELFEMSGPVKRKFTAASNSNDSAKDALDAILDSSNAYPATTAITALPLTSTGSIRMEYSPILRSISLLESFISVFGASLMYKDKLLWDLTNPIEAALFTKGIANYKNKIMTDTLSAYIRVEESLNHHYSKTTTTGDLHMEFLETVFSAFSFPPSVVKQLDGIMTDIAKKFKTLKLSFASTSESMDHMISFHSFEPVEGLDPIEYLEPKLRIFYLHIDQSSWTASIIGKASVNHFEFKMNYVEIKASVNFELVANDSQKLNNYISKASNKKLADIAKATTNAVSDTRQADQK